MSYHWTLSTIPQVLVIFWVLSESPLLAKPQLYIQTLASKGKGPVIYASLKFPEAQELHITWSLTQEGDLNLGLSILYIKQYNI